LGVGDWSVLRVRSRLRRDRTLVRPSL